MPTCVLRQQGFTLIEVIVVMVLLAIIAGSIGLNLVKDPASDVREDAQRLAILINVAREQAILEGNFYGIQLHEKGYAFARLNEKGVFTTIDDDTLLRKREFAHDVLATGFTIDDKSVEIEDSGFILTPVGQLPSFEISLSHHEIKWHIRPTEEGSVQAEPADG